MSFMSAFLESLPIVGNIGSSIYQSYIDKGNLNLQKQNFDYQKKLNERIFSREDTAIQRRVRDLRAAGLSPVLAAGQGARAGNVMSTKAPQRESTGNQMFMQSMSSIMDLMRMKADISKTNAETNLINKQVKKTEADTARTSQLTDHEKRQFNYKLNKLIDETYYLNNSYTARIKMIQNEVKIKGYQETMAFYENENKKAEAYRSGLDRQWHNELVGWLTEKAQTGVRSTFVNGITYNPIIIDYLSNVLQRDIKKHDYEWYKKFFMPTNAHIDKWFTAGGAVINAVQDLVGKGEE